ncbi:aminotransferase class V-fold PLP-dependent enzyme [Dactylosporangium salmoneum]|uniref:Aminotransferase class V-fold PLP-dependent enzyme n=1 Tax=Dactylosporangium salmoneum TaxID=53361 RepID=A0ABP5UWW2_9ACTN
MNDRPTLSDPDDWADRHAGAYLYTAAQGPALRVAVEAFERAFRAQSAGPEGRLALYRYEEQARAQLAAVAGVDAADVALVGDASTAWNLVAGGLDWRPGDNVVLNEFEHPSVVFPFLRLAPAGLEVRIARRDDGWQIPPDAVAALCDDRTRAIATSDVSYVNAYRPPLDALADIAEHRGIPLFVDYSHSLGVLPVDLRRVSIGISASYKWLLGPYGVGILLWNRERLPGFRPGGTGWRSTPDFFTTDRFERYTLDDDAGRFRQGASCFAGAAALAASARYLAQWGPAALAEHALDLSGRFRAGLVERGRAVITPEDPAWRGGSIAWLDPDGERTAARLAERGCLVWGGDGRVRASFHVMNSSGDVAAALSTLDELEAVR